MLGLRALRAPFALARTRGARRLSVLDTVAGMARQKARPEAEQAMSLLLSGASNYSADTSVTTLRRALHCVAPLAESADSSAADSNDTSPPIALAQLASARAVHVMRERVAPSHSTVFELLQHSRRQMQEQAASGGASAGAAESLSLEGDAAMAQWPMVARERWEALGEARSLARAGATLQLIGFALGDENTGNMARNAWERRANDVLGTCEGAHDAARAPLETQERQRGAAEASLCQAVRDSLLDREEEENTHGTDSSVDLVAKDDGTAPEGDVGTAFARVLVQNMEISGVASHDRFLCGPLSFVLQPYLLPRAAQAVQAMNVEVAACLQKLQSISQQLQHPDGVLCDARRPAGPLHPDQALAASEGEYCPEAMRVWARRRSECTNSAVAAFGELTALVAIELAETGGGARGESARNAALLEEAFGLLHGARPIFEMEAQGTTGGDAALERLTQTEERIRAEWVPS